MKRTRIQQQNHDKIIAAALSIFSRYGFRGTTVDQIAHETGMSKANLLYYFRRKEDIYVAVLQTILTVWLEPLKTLDADGDPIDELWRYSLVKLELSWSEPAASRMFASEIIQGAPMIEPFLKGELKELVTNKCAIIQRWIDEGKLVKVEPLHLLFLIWAATQHYADFRTQIDALHKGSEQTLVDGARSTLYALLSGLKPR